MKHSKIYSGFLTFLVLMLSSGWIYAKGSEIKFQSLVSAIYQEDTNIATIIVSVYGLDLTVIINGDTEIEESGDLEKEVALLKEELKKEPDIKIAKSQEVIIQLYNESFRPLFEILHKKLSQFDEMFNEKSAHCGVNSDSGLKDGNSHLSYVDRFITNQQKVIEILQKLKDPDAIYNAERRIIEIDNFVYTISLEGFNKKDDPFSLQVGVEIKFEKFKYHIAPCNMKSIDSLLELITTEKNLTNLICERE